MKSPTNNIKERKKGIESTESIKSFQNDRYVKLLEAVREEIESKRKNLNTDNEWENGKDCAFEEVSSLLTEAITSIKK